MTQGQILSSLHFICKLLAILGFCICRPQWNETLFKSPHNYLAKCSGGPCCILLYNSAGAALGCCSTLMSFLLEQLTPTQLSKLQSLEADSLKSQRAPRGWNISMIHPWNMAGINHVCDTHTHNVLVLQLLCSSLLEKVLSCGKQKAGEGKNWLKAYFTSFARWPAKHTVPERSSSWPLFLQDLPCETWAARRSICPTDSQLAVNKQRSYLSKNSPWADPVARGPWT